jgi:peptide-methionine (R)-S-oxide reductase
MSRILWLIGGLALVLVLATEIWDRFGGDVIMEQTGVPAEGRLTRTDEEWRKLLTAEQYRVTRLKETEVAFSGEYCHCEKDGVYTCVCCGQPLFDASAKFDSGTGWPSFWKPVSKNSVSLQADNSHFMRRTEVLCSRCAAHLGHVFKDERVPTGRRYCMNSVALKLNERPSKESTPEQ